MPLNYELRAVSYGSDDAQMLTAELQAEYSRRYGGPGDQAPIDTRQFDAPASHFVLVYVDAVPAAMGGWRRHDELPAAGITRLVLETGQIQPEAIALYRSMSYGGVEAFGYYVGMGSVHLGKMLKHRRVES